MIFVELVLHFLILQLICRMECRTDSMNNQFDSLFYEQMSRPIVILIKDMITPNLKAKDKHFLTASSQSLAVLCRIQLVETFEIRIKSRLIWKSFLASLDTKWKIYLVYKKNSILQRIWSGDDQNGNCQTRWPRLTRLRQWGKTRASRTVNFTLFISTT